MERYVLPDGWAWTTIPTVADIIMGQSPPSSTYNSEGHGLPFYQGKADFGELHPSPRVWCSALGKIAQVGDILMSVRAPVGPTNVANEECCIGRGLCAIRPLAPIISGYLFRYLRAIEADIASMGTGSTFTAISRADVESIEIPLPPLAEQRRIVEKLDALLAQARDSRAALDRLPTLLKQARQAILAAAFRGDLTERDPADEPADALLARIRAERRARWEADLRARGKDPAKHVYPEPAAPDTRELPELPAGWAWTTVDTIISLLQYGTSVKADSDAERGVPVLRMGNIQEGTLDLTDLKYIDPALGDISKYQLVAGDILINRTNSPELVGKAGLFNHKGTFLFASYLIRLRVPAGQVEPHYLAMCINSQVGRQHVARVKHQVAGQANINSHDIRQMPIPLAPFGEQHRIVDKIVSLQAEADAIEAVARLARRRLDLAEQAVLARAFRGELVPQDPADEPAAAMLARLGEAREAESHERETDSRTPRAKGRAARQTPGQPTAATTAAQGRLGV